MLSTNPSTCSSSGVSILGLPRYASHCSALGRTSNITENMGSSSFHSSDTVYFDAEMPTPSRNIHEDPRRRTLREVTSVDRVHSSKLLDLCPDGMPLAHIHERLSLFLH